MYRCGGISVYRCIGVWGSRCIGVWGYRCIGVGGYRCIGVSVRVGISVYRYRCMGACRDIGVSVWGGYRCIGVSVQRGFGTRRAGTMKIFPDEFASTNRLGLILNRPVLNDLMSRRFPRLYQENSRTKHPLEFWNVKLMDSHHDKPIRDPSA